MKYEATRLWAWMIKLFFSKSLKIKLFPDFYRDSLFPHDYIAYLLPYEDSKIMLARDDIKAIRKFFVKELEMKESNTFKKELEDIRKKGLSSGLPSLVFYYNALFAVNVLLTYARIDGKEYFFLNSIIIENNEDDDDMIETLIGKAEKVIDKIGVPEGYFKEVIDKIKKEIEEERKKNIINEKDKYPEVKELVSVLDEFGVQYLGKSDAIYIKALPKLNSLEISLYASATFVADNGVKIIVKEGLFTDDKMLEFVSPDGKEKVVRLGKNVKYGTRSEYFIIKFREKLMC